MFVRTSNNEIIDLSYCRYFEEEHRYWNGAGCYSFEECEIIKKADTIEELVDMYVVKVVENGYVLYEKGWHNKLVNIARDDYKKEATIYAHIWVDDNLIKVAKMNEKGELELC